MMNNENGRSMVEMLGVLAIIGVLSVAGIAGYTMAMKKYRVNEIVNTASQVAILARAMNAGNGDKAVANTAGNGNTGIKTPSGASEIEADCTSDTTSTRGGKCKVTITYSDSSLQTLVETAIGTDNGFYVLS